MSRTLQLLIAYDGTNYHGWQRQDNGITVQEAIEDGLALICKRPVTLHGAGRTDAGVHAEGMVAHFQIEQPIPQQAFVRGLNSILARDIRILDAIERPSTFHSRFSALGKTYRYDFFTGEIQIPHQRLYAAHYPCTFNAERVNQAVEYLLGSHDFSSFERTGSRDPNRKTGRGAVRTIHTICCNAKADQPECWSIRVTGDGFLRQMVRILSGTLIEIGSGQLPPEAMRDIVAAHDRKAAGITAPAHGLFLEKVYYREILKD